MSGSIIAPFAALRRHLKEVVGPRNHAQLTLDDLRVELAGLGLLRESFGPEEYRAVLEERPWTRISVEELPDVAFAELGEEFLGLPESDRRRAENAFRIKAVREHRPGRLSRRRLSDLARAYEDELREPVLSVGLRREATAVELPDALPATLGELWSGSDGYRRRTEMRRPEFSDAVALALKTEEADWRPEADAAPEWERLAYAAMADAGLVADEPPAKDARENGSGVRGAGDRVFDAYHLARYKVAEGRSAGSAAAGRLDGRGADA